MAGLHLEVHPPPNLELVVGSVFHKHVCSLDKGSLCESVADVEFQSPPYPMFEVAKYLPTFRNHKLISRIRSAKFS